MREEAFSAPRGGEAEGRLSAVPAAGPLPFREATSLPSGAHLPPVVGHGLVSPLFRNCRRHQLRSRPRWRVPRERLLEAALASRSPQDPFPAVSIPCVAEGDDTLPSIAPRSLALLAVAVLLPTAPRTPERITPHLPQTQSKIQQHSCAVTDLTDHTPSNKVCCFIQSLLLLHFNFPVHPPRRHSLTPLKKSAYLR